MKNVFFVGKAGSGKSSMSTALVNDYDYTHVRFAGHLYNLAYEYFNMSKVVKNRKLLQIMGTEVGRMQIHSDLWVNRLMEDIKIIEITSKEMGYDPKRFVLDDCRFPNEYSALRNNGWVGIYLDVPDSERCSRLMGRDGRFSMEEFQHASETSIDTFKDFLIRVDASGTKEQTYKQVKDIVTSI